MNQQAGQELKKIRESKGLSLDEAASALCLRTDLLRELEDGEEERNLPDAYRKLSLRMYARYLGVSFNCTREENSIELSPVNGCVELAYSEKMRGEPEPNKRRAVGAGTMLATAAVLILTVGLWSLNAKISRLNLDERKPRPVASDTAQQPKAGLHTPSAAGESVRLDEAVSLTLAPTGPAPAATPDAP